MNKVCMYVCVCRINKVYYKLLLLLFVELSEIGGIGSYCWNGGGSWKGRKWDQELPNDSQVKTTPSRAGLITLL